MTFMFKGPYEFRVQVHDIDLDEVLFESEDPAPLPVHFLTGAAPHDRIQLGGERYVVQGTGYRPFDLDEDGPGGSLEMTVWVRELAYHNDLVEDEV